MFCRCGSWRVAVQNHFCKRLVTLDTNVDRTDRFQGDLLLVDKVPEAKVGEPFNINEVLMLGTKAQTIIGRPFVADTSVRCVGP